MTRNILKNCLVSLAALALLPAAATAQTATALDDPLGIPADISLLGEANPNVRTATAIVNGHVITGTDIDQRVALVISASNNQLSEEDLSRLRMQHAAQHGRIILACLAGGCVAESQTVECSVLE